MGSHGPPTEVIEVTENLSVETHKATDNPWTRKHKAKNNSESLKKQHCQKAQSGNWQAGATSAPPNACQEVSILLHLDSHVASVATSRLHCHTACTASEIGTPFRRKEGDKIFLDKVVQHSWKVDGSLYLGLEICLGATVWLQQFPRYLAYFEVPACWFPPKTGSAVGMSRSCHLF